MKLFSVEDQNRLSEARKHSEERIEKLASILSNRMVTEAQGYDVGELLFAEAFKYEKLRMVEAVSDQDFNTLQKNFRSMLRAAGSLVKNLAGTELADKLDVLRITGIEELNELYEDVKDVEQGIKDEFKSKKASQARDKFAKTFAEFAVLMRGAMALADLFSDDPATLSGYTAMKEIVASLEADNLTSVSLRDAFETYEKDVEAAKSEKEPEDIGHDKWFKQGEDIEWVTDTSKGEVPTSAADTSARPKHLKPKKKSFLSRLFGLGREEKSRNGNTVNEASKKGSNLENKFRKLIQSTISDKSPGFARMINISALTDQLMGKSYDHLAAIFGRFNDFVASDIDENFLVQTIQKPLTVASALKGAWDVFSSGTMGGLRGRA